MSRRIALALALLGLSLLPAAHVGERDRLAVEPFEEERRRGLVAERRDLERREQVVETIVRGRRQQRDCDEDECAGEPTA